MTPLARLSKDHNTTTHAANNCFAGSPARLQGELAVSRAIGDLPYLEYGLISDPELRWHDTSATDRWLVLASDGIFERISVDVVCQVAAQTEAGTLFGSKQNMYTLSSGQPSCQP